MTIRQIENEADYDAALAAIDRLMDAAPDTPESDELEALATLVEAYEAKHWPIEDPAVRTEDRSSGEEQV